MVVAPVDIRLSGIEVAFPCPRRAHRRRPQARVRAARVVITIGMAVPGEKSIKTESI